MHTKTVVYYPEYNKKLISVLRDLWAGIPGAEFRDQRDYVDCDIAVVFGLVKRDYSPTWQKAPILEKHQGRRLIVVESGFFRRSELYQVGFGGYSGHADFRNEGAPADRWETMKVRPRPWRRWDRGPVVVCGQLPRDTQVQDVDHTKWCRDTVEALRQEGHDVWFRPHPKVADISMYGVSEDLTIDTRKFVHTLRDARCFVTYNSTSGVNAAIKGIPVVAVDEGSMAWPVASHSLEGVGRPWFPSRKRWLAGIGYAQWTREEMRAGLPWRHLTRPEGAPVQSCLLGEE